MQMMVMWRHMFVLGLPWAEKVLRPILVYAFLIVGLRLSGKRELAQLNPFDLVVLLTLSNTVQNAIIGNDNSLLGGLVGAAVLVAVNALVIRLTYNSPKLDRLIEGQPTDLVRDGKELKNALKHERITKQELMSVVHRQGIAHLDDVERVTLEPTGTFTVIGRRMHPEQVSHQQ